MAEVVINEMRGVVGAKVLSPGAQSAVRLTNDGSQGVAMTAARYYELVMTGRVFNLTLDAWSSTIAAGNINAAAAAASTQFALWNPSGSGYNLVILLFSVAPISGTAPLAGCYHSYSSTAPTIANAAVTPVSNAKVGGPTSCAAGYLTSAAGANLTGSAALKLIRQAAFTITAGAMGTTGGFGSMLLEAVDGSIVLTPGTGWVPTWKAAGTTFLGGYSVSWYEAPA